MFDYHKHGKMKKGAALVVAACFLLGSSASALAAGNGVAKAYQGLAADTSVKEFTKADVLYSDEDLGDAVSLSVDAGWENSEVNLITKPYDLDPDKVVMTGDEVIIGPGRETRGITWTIPAGMTFMTSGFKVKTGDRMSAMVVPTPDDIEYETGFKDGKDIMHCVLITGINGVVYTVEDDGRHYFYITNPSETEELHIEASVIVSHKEEEPEPTEPTE